MMDRQTTFQDETTSDGRVAAEFAGLGRATIAGRWPSDEPLDWFASLLHEAKAYLRSNAIPEEQEIKSVHLLAARDEVAVVRSLIERNLGRATIVIVDFWGYIDKSIRMIRRAFRLQHAPLIDPYDVVREGVPMGFVNEMIENAEAFGVECSALGRAETLVSMAVNDAGLPRGRRGQLVGRERLRAMRRPERKEALVRLAGILGDALHPERIRNAIEEDMPARFFNPSAWAVTTLHDSIDVNRVFDEGCEAAFAVVEEAHHELRHRLETSRRAHISATIGGGTLAQEDSALVRGLQVADLSASVARELYSEYPHDREAGARAVAQAFDQVLFNGEWLVP